MTGDSNTSLGTALLVLGGEHPSHRTRSRAALQHYRACHAMGHPLPQIIVTGAGRVMQPTGVMSEAQHMATYLQDHGVPACHIWQEDQAQNTPANIVLGAALALRHGVCSTQLVLVTDDFHLPRSRWLFQRLLGHVPHACIQTGERGTVWLRWREHWARAIHAWRLAHADMGAGAALRQ